MYISVIAIEEIDKIKNDVKKQNISELIVKYKIKVLDLSNKAKDLADEYMNKGAIPIFGGAKYGNIHIIRLGGVK